MHNFMLILSVYLTICLQFAYLLIYIVTVKKEKMNNITLATCEERVIAALENENSTRPLVIIVRVKSTKSEYFFQSTRPTGRVFWEELLVLSSFTLKRGKKQG